MPTYLEFIKTIIGISVHHNNKRQNYSDPTTEQNTSLGIIIMREIKNIKN